MKKILVFSLAIAAFLGARAQSETFPLLFSQYGMNGTAANIGKAGAIGALGGDFTAASYNPAGLGVYRSSELTFTSGIDFGSSTGNFNGMKTDDNATKFNFGNLGMVLNVDSGKKGWRTVQFSVGVNTLMNFNSSAKIYREGLQSSYVNDVVLDQIVDANDTNSMFIQSGVVDMDNNYTISSVYENGVFTQLKSIRETGYLDEFTMSVSGNYDNWLFLGATMGVPFGQYTCKTSFSEERFVSGVSTGYYNYNTEQDLSVAGVNLKLGAIVKPVHWLRLGLAVHTPTYYTVDDDYYGEVQYNSWSGGWYPTYTYSMQSPWRFIFSGAVVLGNNASKLGGTISLDYERLSYAGMSFFMDDDIRTETALNNSIDANFTSTGNLKLGGELKYGSLRLRAGYAHYGNPYEKSVNDGSWDYLTCGFGYRGKIFSFDLAYSHGSTEGKYYMYSADANPATTLSYNKNLIQATFGMHF